MNRKTRTAPKARAPVDSRQFDISPEASAALTAGGVGLWRWDVSGGGILWTDNLNQIHGLPPGSFDGTFEFFLNDVHPEDRAHLMERIERALASGTTYHVTYRIAASGGGEERWVEARGEVVRKSGRARLMTGICHDITEKRRTEQKLEQRVLQQEALATLGKVALGENAFDALCREAVRLVANVLRADYAKILQLLPSGDALLLRAGTGWKDGLVGQATVGAGAVSQAGFTLQSDLPVVVEDLARETRFRGPSLLIEHGVVSGLSVVIPGSEGRPFGVFGVHTKTRRKFTVEDVSFLESAATIVASSAERALVEQRRNLVLREMRHRSGNLLAVIASMIARTAESSTTVEEMSHKLRSRVVSLSEAHAIIMQGGWSSTPLEQLLSASLSAYGEQVRTRGRSVLIPADMAFALSMVIHELATNAVKYGALSSGDGSIEIEWRVESSEVGKVLALSWKETGVPGPVEDEPRLGFGSRLIRSVVDQQLGGSFSRDVHGNGFSVTFRLPMGE